MNENWTTRRPTAGAHRAAAPISSLLADFAAGLDYQSLPISAVDTLRWHILDTLACAVAGRDLDIAQSARQAGAAMGAGGCRVFGGAQRLGAPAAAFVNATLANGLDFDDGFELAGKGMGHPGSSIVTAALAACDGREVSGQDFIAAVAAGYEINNRLILSIQPSAERFAQVYGVSQHQAIGACVAYGRLRGLDRDGLQNAMGLAGGLTPVPSLHKYNWNLRPIISMKDFVAPAALSGVMAVEMSLAGFIGSHDLFDGATGYWRMLGSDCFDDQRLLADLGKHWYLEDSSFKLYPACRWMASALEAFEHLRDTHELLAADITAVEVDSFSTLVDKLMTIQPLNAIDAQFSLPYTLAALALRVPVGKAWFERDTLASPVVLDLARKVSARLDPAMDRDMSGVTRRPSARVRVRCRDGRAFEHTVLSPLGSQTRPADPARLLAKAVHNLEGLSVPADVLARRLLRLDEEASVATAFEPLWGV